MDMETELLKHSKVASPDSLFLKTEDAVNEEEEFIWLADNHNQTTYQKMEPLMDIKVESVRSDNQTPPLTAVLIKSKPECKFESHIKQEIDQRSVRGDASCCREYQTQQNDSRLLVIDEIKSELDYYTNNLSSLEISMIDGLEYTIDEGSETNVKDIKTEPESEIISAIEESSKINLCLEESQIYEMDTKELPELYLKTKLEEQETECNNRELIDDNDHSATAVILSSWFCLYCKNNYADLHSFDKHLEKKHPDVFLRESNQFQYTTIYYCSECKIAYLSNDGLKRHYETRHEGRKPSSHQASGKFFCEFCRMQLTSIELLKEHQRFHQKTHHQQGKRKALARLAALKHLKKMQNGLNPRTIRPEFQCDLCRIIFPSDILLKEHMKTHFHHENYSKMNAAVPRNLNSYIYNLSPQKSRSELSDQKNISIARTFHSFTCEGCLKEFIIKTQSKGHERVYTEGNLDKCKSCKNTATLQS